MILLACNKREKVKIMNIYQIAEKAGVSIATVSRVLNNSEHVSEKTREKIERIIKEDNYRPNILARGLALDTIKIIGVICTDPSDAFIAKALGLLQAGLHKRKYDTLLFCVGSHRETTLKHIRYLQNKHVDAIFLVGSGFSDTVDREALGEVARAIPIITVNGSVDIENVYSVCCDDKAGIGEAVDYLVKEGEEKIIFLYDNMTQSTKRKIEGFAFALERNGIRFSDELIINATDTLKGSEEALDRLLENGIKFDSVIATSDLIALGAQKALEKKGIKKKVIGFDNTFLCECATPELSSVDPSLETMCEKALSILDTISEGKKPEGAYVCKPKLVIR
jgi:LacI family transcriptional regulator/LacI family asc operon transcriptional repressor